jgi:hypothetical protein
MQSKSLFELQVLDDVLTMHDSNGSPSSDHPVKRVRYGEDEMSE